MKKIGILGSTGSIGTQALSLIEENPERYTVTALSCRHNIKLLMEQIDRFSPRLAVVEDAEAAKAVKDYCSGKNTEVISGLDGLLEIARSEADIILTSLVGSVGLIPTLEALTHGKTIALANKETLVTAGRLVMEQARKHGAAILPVDSEHSAIFQALQGNSAQSVSRLILTASGGAFQNLQRGRNKGQEGGRSPEAPELEHGLKNNHRFGNPDEQGTGSNRSPLAVRYAGGTHRRGGSSPKHHSFNGGIYGQLDYRPDGSARHASAHTLRLQLS